MNDVIMAPDRICDALCSFKAGLFEKISRFPVTAASLC